MHSRPRGVLSLDVLVIVTELRDGTVAVAPAADLRCIAHGEHGAALAQLRTYLERVLPDATPERVAQHAVPRPPRGEAPWELWPVARAIARIALRQHDPRPGARARVVEVPVHAAVLPDDAGRWIVMPALAHTAHVASWESVEERVAEEAQLRASAHELSGSALLALLSPRSVRVERLRIGVERDELATGGRARAELASALALDDAYGILEDAGRALPKDAPPILIGREGPLASLDALLVARDRLSVLVRGPELAGKSSVVRAWAASHGARPVYAVSPARLLATGDGTLDWRARVQRVMQAAERADAILFFEDAAAIADERPESPVDLAGAMLPFLDARRVRVIAEIRDDALDRLEKQKASFVSAFARVVVPPLSPELTVLAIVERSQRDATVHPAIGEDAARVLVARVRRLMPYRALPGEASVLADEIRAGVGRVRDEHGVLAPITPDEVEEGVARRTGMPAALLRDDVPLSRERIEAFFTERLSGQRAAIRRVAETLCVVKAGLPPEGRPLATFLFAGPTGVGKTEVARVLAEWLFGSSDALVRFDMSEYADAWAAERLVRGTDRDDGLLTRAVRQRPFAVILLDEVEKAHPAIFDLLLSMLGEGRLTDARGRTAYFHDTIVVMTSNLGATSSRARAGFGASPEPDAEHYARAAREAFRPELLNRIDRIVAFDPLGDDDVRRIARLSTRSLATRHGLVQRGATVRLTDGALERLSARGTSPGDGARALRRATEDFVVAPIARVISQLGEQARGAEIVIRAPDEPAPSGAPVAVASAMDGALALSAHVTSSRKAMRAEPPLLSRIAAARRRMERWCSADAVEDVGHRVGELVASLARARRRKRDERELVPMLVEHARLDAPWRRLGVARADLSALEEMALLAFVDDAPLGELESELSVAERAAAAALLDVFFAIEPPAARAVLTLDELDGGKPMSRYLPPLLDAVDGLGWKLAAHFPSSAAIGEPDPTWPARALWGPPQAPQLLRAALRDPTRSFKQLLLVIEGRAADALMGAERGLHELDGDDLRIHRMSPEAQPKSSDRPPKQQARGADRTHRTADREVRFSSWPALRIRYGEEGYFAHLATFALLDKLDAHLPVGHVGRWA